MIAAEGHPNFARLTALLNQQRSPRKTLNMILSVMSRKEEGAMPYYIICPLCGAALDPGERCDCTKEKAPGTAGTVTSAGEGPPPPEESKAMDKRTRRTLKAIARLSRLNPYGKAGIITLIDELTEAQKHGGGAVDPQAGG